MFATSSLSHVVVIVSDAVYGVTLLCLEAVNINVTLQ